MKGSIFILNRTIIMKDKHLLNYFVLYHLLLALYYRTRLNIPGTERELRRKTNGKQEKQTTAGSAITHCIIWAIRQYYKSVFIE